jgi:hypothetical protein
LMVQADRQTKMRGTVGWTKAAVDSASGSGVPFALISLVSGEAGSNSEGGGLHGRPTYSAFAPINCFADPVADTAVSVSHAAAALSGALSVPTTPQNQKVGLPSPASFGPRHRQWDAAPPASSGWFCARGSDAPITRSPAWIHAGHADGMRVSCGIPHDPHSGMLLGGVCLERSQSMA